MGGNLVPNGLSIDGKVPSLILGGTKTAQGWRLNGTAIVSLIRKLLRQDPFRP